MSSFRVCSLHWDRYCVYYVYLAITSSMYGVQHEVRAQYGL